MQYIAPAKHWNTKEEINNPKIQGNPEELLQLFINKAYFPILLFLIQRHYKSVFIYVFLK